MLFNQWFHFPNWKNVRYWRYFASTNFHKYDQNTQKLGNFLLSKVPASKVETKSFFFPHIHLRLWKEKLRTFFKVLQMHIRLQILILPKVSKLYMKGLRHRRCFCTLKYHVKRYSTFMFKLWNDNVPFKSLVWRESTF